jgi:hypothetical protein
MCGVVNLTPPHPHLHMRIGYVISVWVVSVVDNVLDLIILITARINVFAEVGSFGACVYRKPCMLFLSPAVQILSEEVETGYDLLFKTGSAQRTDVLISVHAHPNIDPPLLLVTFAKNCISCVGELGIWVGIELFLACGSKTSMRLNDMANLQVCAGRELYVTSVTQFESLHFRRLTDVTLVVEGSCRQSSDCQICEEQKEGALHSRFHGGRRRGLFRAGVEESYLLKLGAVSCM